MDLMHSRERVWKSDFGIRIVVAGVRGLGGWEGNIPGGCTADSPVGRREVEQVGF